MILEQSVRRSVGELDHSGQAQQSGCQLWTDDACRYRVPALLAVGLEGFWGLVISAVALPILGMVRGTDGLPLDSTAQAFRVCPSTWSGHP